MKDSWPEEKIPRLVNKMIDTYQEYGDMEQIGKKRLPSKDEIKKILEDFMSMLFPSYYGNIKINRVNIKYCLGVTLISLYNRLNEEIEKSLMYNTDKKQQGKNRIKAKKITREILEKIPEIRSRLKEDIKAAFDGDPAANSYEEIMLSYPCVYAISTYRIAHELYLRNVPITPRIMSEHAHSKTGIDIHPGAKIGKNFFIDHGTGVVIGETTIIGDNVRIYQGVTLGGQNVPKNNVFKLKGIKRHPTIGDNVIIYAGATILGGETEIEKDSIIGGNVWITSSISSNTIVNVAPSKLSYKTQK